MKNLNSIGEQVVTQIKQLDTPQVGAIPSWGVTAAAALSGGIALNIAARGLLAVVATLTSPPVALSVGAIAGGFFGWRYTQRRQPAVDSSTHDTNSQGIAVQSVVETSAQPDGQTVPSSPLPEAREPETIHNETMAEIIMEAPTESTIADDATVINESDAGVENISPLHTAPPTTLASDKLEAIRGIGPVFAKRLRAAGIHTFAQLSELLPEEVKVMIAPIRTGQRAEVVDWIEEAKQRIDQKNQTAG